MKLCLALALVVMACSKSAPEPAPAPAPDPQAIDTLVANMMAYTEQTVPLLLAWDGDCAAQATRMLALEPMATKIRAQGAVLEADPAAYSAFKAAMAAKKEAVMAAVEAKLTAAGSSLKDMSTRERAIREQCKTDLAFNQAMDRVGLAKKK